MDEIVDDGDLLPRLVEVVENDRGGKHAVLFRLLVPQHVDGLLAVIDRGERSIREAPVRKRIHHLARCRAELRIDLLLREPEPHDGQDRLAR